MKRLTAAALAALLFASPGTADEGNQERFDGHTVVRTILTSRRQLERMFEISPDLWSEAPGLGGPTDWRIPPERMGDLDAADIPYQIIIHDVQALIDAQNDPGNLPLGGSWFNDYKTLDQITAQLEVLRNLQPDMATTFDAGTTIQGRTFRGIRFGGNGQDSPVFLIQGCQHAREWVSPMVTMFITEHLLSNYGTDPEVTRLVDAIEFIIVPVVNADGYLYTWTNNRMWRKNRRDNGGGSFGVDLNRNWSVGWGGNDGSSGSPDNETYRGTAPFSEPESTSMKNIVDSVGDRIGFHLDLHSYSQLVLTPWGYTTNLPPDHDAYMDLASDMHDAIQAVHGKNYIFGPAASTLYIASGIAPDYTTGTYGAAGMTIELRDTGEFGFLLPADQIIPNGEEIVPAIHVVADWLTRAMEFSFPGGLPNVIPPDATTMVTVQIVGVNGATVDPATAMLHSRIGDSGPFNASPMSSLGNDLYEALLPAAPCGSTVEFYFSAETTGGAVGTSPAAAPDLVYEALAITVDIAFEDDFETNKGWIVQNVDLTDGAWERGIPAGAGDRGDPTTDFDGSGRCYLTANRSGNSDVDGGPTRLTSPTFDLSGMQDATLSYARWFFNDDGDIDSLDVEISNDGGGTWTLIESVSATGGTGWVWQSVLVSDFVSPTNQVVVRFSATDNPNDSVTEAAIDAVTVGEAGCEGGSTALTSFNVTTGALLGGDLDDLRVSDDSSVRTRSGFGSTLVDLHNMTMQVTAATTVGSPATVDLRFEWRIDEPAGTAQVRAFDVNTGLYDLVGTFPINNGADQVRTITNLDANDYVAGDSTIEIEIKHIVFVPFLAFTFESFIDEVNVSVQ